MTEFNIEQDCDPELVEKELTDEPVDTKFDLPDYDATKFEYADDDEEGIEEEEEDGEIE